MNPPRILIAGIGNIFLGDDAFGVEVAQRLLRRPFPPDVRVVDFGIRGIDLFYTLLEGCQTVILVDAVQRGQSPGTLYLIEPDPTPASQLAPEELMIQGHSLDPMRVLQLAAAMGDRVKRVLLVGCEPQACGSDDEPFPLGMSEPVRAAVEQAVVSIESFVEQILAGETESLTFSPPRAAKEFTHGSA
jgi:hydrogenase maturation protease